MKDRIIIPSSGEWILIIAMIGSVGDANFCNCFKRCSRSDERILHVNERFFKPIHAGKDVIDEFRYEIFPGQDRSRSSKLLALIGGMTIASSLPSIGVVTFVPSYDRMPS
nr:hypothetical protein [Tanacetum cinerariifolium]